MNVGSLFSGIGGMDYGLHRAGFTHLFFCESDEWRRSVLAKHWPGVPIYDDVRAVGKPEGGTPADGASAPVDDGGGQARAGVPVHSDAPLDLLVGGFPCQDLSVAGNRAGLAGSRSGLFFEFARIIDALQPRWVLIENVPGLLSSNGGRDFGIVLGTLADLGYGVAWRTLDSRFFGVPQRRRRVFILATVADGDPRGAAQRAGEVLAVGSRCTGHLEARGEARPDVASTLGGSVGNGRGHDGNPFDRGGHSSLSGLGSVGPDDNDAQAGRLIAMCLNAKKDNRDDGESETFVTGFHMTQDPISSAELAPAMGSKSTGMGVGVGVGVRRLTPTECERLQALPDGWTAHGPDSRRYRALGDAVTASVAQWIGERLLERDAA